MSIAFLNSSVLIGLTASNKVNDIPKILLYKISLSLPGLVDMFWSWKDLVG